MPVTQKALDLEFPRKFGGRQEGAGRPRTTKHRVTHHVRREEFSKNHPIHITFRVKDGLPSLRTQKFLKQFRQTLSLCSSRPGFRVIHYSVQSNHVHCIVEADGKESLGNGMKSLVARFARAVNRVFDRTGKVMEGRYHLAVLKTPKQVRNAIAYVLLNHRHHQSRAKAWIDDFSSGEWFDGWKDVWVPVPSRVCEVAAATLWLLTTGWRRYRRIAVHEVPG